jgi:hypothetical protein
MSQQMVIPPDAPVVEFFGAHYVLIAERLYYRVPLTNRWFISHFDTKLVLGVAKQLGTYGKLQESL